MLEHDGVNLVLNLVAKPVQIDYPQSAGTMAIFQVEDIQATAKDYRAKGVEIIDSPCDFPSGTFMAFKDPFGNVHGIMQPRPE